MKPETRPLNPLYLCGPTASGKSGAALALAHACGGEIVNADAFQLYRGLETLTAAPSPETQAAVPHHLYSVIDPAERFDAARYRRLALPVLAEIQSRDRVPIVVGGSGLYLKFLSHGPSDLPAADPELRRELEALPLEELNRRLAELDPVEAARIDRHNPRYVQRALEICLLTGRPVSGQRTSFQSAPARLRGIVLNFEPAALEARIRRRTRDMFAGGALEEVAALLERLPALRNEPAAGAAKAIGFREIRRFLAGEIDLAACEELIVIATRRYAKRQRTWFRREPWLTPVPGDSSPETFLKTAQSLLSSDP